MIGTRMNGVGSLLLRWWVSVAVVASCCAALTPPLHAATVRKAKTSAVAHASAEARLLEVYRLIGAGENRQALAKAESLARDVPNFQLAQLVYGDLLLTRRGKLDTVEVPPSELPASAAAQWSQLRQEAALRLAALTERPPANALLVSATCARSPSPPPSIRMITTVACSIITSNGFWTTAPWWINCLRTWAGSSAAVRVTARQRSRG